MSLQEYKSNRKKENSILMGAEAFHIDPGVNIVYSVPYI